MLSGTVLPRLPIWSVFSLIVLLVACGGGGSSGEAVDQNGGAITGVAGNENDSDNMQSPQTNLPIADQQPAAEDGSNTPETVDNNFCSSLQQNIQIALPTDLLQSLNGQLATKIQEAIGQRSDGSNCVEILPNATVFDAAESVDALKSGDLQIALLRYEDIVQALPEMALFDLPFLFNDIDAVRRFQLSDDGIQFRQSLSRDGLQVNGFVNRGMVHMSSNRSIVEPADVNNLKMVGNFTELFQAQYIALNAFPFSIAFAERYNAMLTGVVDGQESEWTTADANLYDEVQTHFTDSQHRVYGDVVAVSADWWSGLDPDVRNGLQGVISTAIEENEKAAELAQKDARAALESRGAQIRELDASERAAWKSAMLPVFMSNENNIGVDFISAAMRYNDDVNSDVGDVTGIPTDTETTGQDNNPDVNTDPDSEANSNGSGEQTTEPDVIDGSDSLPVQPTDISPAIVFSLGGKFDRAFNQSAFEGFERFASESGIDYSEFEVTNELQIEPALRRMAQRGSSPIVTIGGLNAEALTIVAQEFPDINFIIIDAVVNLPNVRSVTFKEQEGSFLAGMLAAIASEGRPVGFIGGRDIPLTARYACGFQQGAKYVAPAMTVIENITGTTPAAWNNPDRGNELATAQFNQGVEVVYSPAAGTSIGVYQAAAEQGVFAIGADTNQNFLYPGTMLSSMLKRVDIAAYQSLVDARNGNWTPGIQSLGLAEEGVDWAIDEFNESLITTEMKEALTDATNKIIVGDLLVHDFLSDDSCPI